MNNITHPDLKTSAAMQDNNGRPIGDYEKTDVSARTIFHAQTRGDGGKYSLSFST